MTDQDGNPESLLDAKNLRERLLTKRRSEHLSLRDVADQTGVSVPTVSRVLRGHVPERENLLRLARWVDMPIGSVTQTGQQAQTVHAADADTVQAVELHLRADKDLTGENAEALADLFRIAYERFRIPRDGDGA
jgi:transcriptional regulator with XRE-family HTH domain